MRISARVPGSWPLFGVVQTDLGAEKFNHSIHHIVDTILREFMEDGKTIELTLALERTANNAAVKEFLRKHGFVVLPDQVGRAIRVSGTVAQIRDAFHTQIKYLDRRHRHFGPDRSPVLPDGVVAIFGLTNATIAHPRS